MRPYLAVIADSFRAASSSRILWIALLCVGLFLVALAPVGYRENVVSRISPLEIVDAQRLTLRLAADLAEPSDSPSSRVAAALPEPLQERILAAAQDGGSRLREEDYAAAFNQLIAGDPSWYDAEAWEQQTTRLTELRELDEQASEDLSETLRGRRDRLRLEAALRGSIRPRPEKTISLTYATFETPAEWPLSRFLFRQYLTTMVLPLVLNGMLGYIGVVLGILVTAPILPDMLQPGSLHLLLSKPISRPLLYVSKFIGGCAFMLMCVAPLLIGVWLILGMRFDLWLHGLFYCIPVYMLLFMVYYSVSCLAALQWKSSIVAALVAIGFWVACGTVGFASGLLDGLVSEPARVSRVMVYGDGDDIFATTRAGLLQRWDATASRWLEVPLEDYRGDVVLGPVPVGAGQYATTRKSLSGMGLGGDGVLAILETDGARQIRRGTKLPNRTVRLLATSDNGVLASGPSGVFFASGESLRESQAAKIPSGNFLEGLANLLNRDAKGFRSVLPDDFYVQSPLEVEILPSDDLLVYSAGTLLRLNRDPQSKQWQQVASREVGGEVSRAAKLAVSHNRVLVHRDDEPVRVFDLESLESRDEIELPSGKKVASLSGSPAEDRFAVLFTDDTASMLSDREGQGLQFAPLPEALAGETIEFLRYNRQGQLLAAYAHDSVLVLSPDDDEVVHRLRPQLSNWRRLNEYVVQPLQYLIPQTGELRAETTRAALSGGSSQEIGEGFLAERTRTRLDVKRPVFTCLGFTAVMLLIGSLMITRQDY